jgi:hypothetical protein
MSVTAVDTSTSVVTAARASAATVTRKTTLPTGATIFNVEDYGAVGDGVTDDFPAVQRAWNAMLNSGGSGQVYFPRAVVYRCVVDDQVVVGAGGQYAALPLPARATDNSHPKLWYGIAGVGEAYSTREYPGAGSTTAKNTTSTVILVDYSTPFAWDDTNGHPSFIGAPDVDAGNNFTNLHFTVDHITMRQPDNPSLCGINLETCVTARVEDFCADVDVALDASSEPTHATGVPLLLPKTGNAINVAVRKYLAWGYYAGYPITEHCDADSLEIVACKIGAFFRRTDSAHFCQIKYLSAEEVPWGIAGYDPSATTANGGVTACPGWILQLLFWDVEDFDRGGGADWMYPGTTTKKAHLYDPNNALKGWAWANRVDSGAEAGPFDKLYVKGGSNFGLYQIAGRDSAITRGTGGDPAAAAPPDTPTIGTATAGDASASVTFTPAGTGETATSFTATSTPGSHTGTGGSSPVTVSGLSNGTSYTFTVHASNAAGDSSESSSSNSVTPSASGPTTYAADTFTRADSNTTLGTSSGGQAWSSLDGVWGIKSNQAYHVSDGGTDPYEMVVLDAGHSSVTYTIDFVPRSGPMDNGLCALVQDRSNLVFWDISGDGSAGANNMTTRLFHRSGGSFTGITSSTNVTMAGGTTYHLKMVVASTSISCYIDNSLIFASSGATGLESQTQFGLMMADSQADTLSVWDNLLITSS